MTPLKSLRQRYVELSDAYRLLLQLKAITGGLSRSLLPECLREAGVPPPRGQVWNPGDIRSAFATLRRIGLTDDKERVVPALEHDLSLEGLKRMAPAVRRVLDRGAGIHTTALRLRIAVYERDLDAYRKARTEALALEEGGNHPFDGQFTDTPTDPRWLASLPPRIALDIVANNAAPLADAGRITPNLDNCMELLPKLRSALMGLPPCPALILFDALSGRYAEARAQLVPLLQDKSEFRGPMFQGIITFLEGGDAVPPLKEAQKRFRKACGKRKAVLPGPGGLCLALALIRSDQPGLREECAALLHELSPRQPAYKGLMAARTLLGLAAGRPDAAALHRLESLPADPLSEAVFHAVDASLDDGVHHARAVETLFERFRGRLPLIACLLAETLARLDPKGGWKERSLPIRHVRLTDFLDRRESWERVFDALVHRLQQPAAEKAGKRLAWLVDTERFRVEALEQSAKADGWTAGRAISLKRLHEEAETLDWLSEQDRAVLATLRWSRTWNGTTCEADPCRALPALAGHPNLLRASDRVPISLACKPVELVVRQERNGYSLALSRWVPRGELQCVEAAPRSYVLYHLPERLEGAADLLGEHGLNVPPEGGPRVLELVRNLDEDVVRPVIRAEDVAASPRLVVRLRPVGVGLEVALFCRPFGLPGTPAFPVGDGPAAPLADIEGRTVRTERDFTEETHAARDLARRCPTLRERGGNGPWTLEDTEASLDCLLELEHAGAELEWPEGEKLRVCPQVSADRLSVDVRHSREWFALQGQIRVNESLVLDMAQVLERLAQAKGRFVPLGDGAFLALTRQFRQQLDRLDRLTERENGACRIHPLAADTVRDLLDGAEVRGDDAWESLLRRIRTAETGTPAVPSTLRAELRDYQIDGFVWLSRLARWGAGACLADDMGLGKTVQTIAVLLAQAASGPSIIIAPTSVCHNWENELSRFAPTLAAHRFGPGDRAARVASLGPGDVLIASYGLLHTEAKCLSGRDWRVAVFDEAQALKNADTRRARASRQIPAAFRVALTGTPIENRLEDLWSLFNLINPGLLGTRQSFQKRFAAISAPAPGEENAEERASEAQSAARQALRALVRPFILRRTKSEVLTELPPRTEQLIEVELPDDERAFYEALRRAALAALEAARDEKELDGSRTFSILTELTKLRRACCAPALVNPETPLSGAKLSAFMDLVSELVRGGHKALVFSQFVGCLTEARKRLDAAGYAYQYLDGSTPERERRSRVAAFQSGVGDLFLISLKAGGQGLNLTAADYVIHLDPWWNPAVEDQASDRAYRLGQKRPVTVYRLVARGTVEESIIRLHRSKRALAADVLSGADVPLSEAELLELIRG